MRRKKFLWGVWLGLFWGLTACSEPDILVSTHLNLQQVARIQEVWQQQPQEEFRFIVMGDNRPAFAGDRKTGDVVLTKIVEEVNALQPAPLFVINTGDLVLAGGFEDQYKHFLQMMEQCHLPFLVTPGNHDYYFGGSTFYRKYFGDAYYHFDLGEWRFIFLDNALGSFSGEEVKWLEKLLAERHKSFLFMHQPPPLGKWRPHASADSEVLFKLVRNKSVQAAFCGHIHGYGEQVYEGVRYVVSGGAGAPLYRNIGDIETFYHYLIVTVKKSGEWSCEVKKVEVEAEKRK